MENRRIGLSDAQHRFCGFFDAHKYDGVDNRSFQSKAGADEIQIVSISLLIYNNFIYRRTEEGIPNV